MIHVIRDDSGRTLGSIVSGTDESGRPWYRSGTEYVIGRKGSDLSHLIARSADRRRQVARDAEREFKAEVLRCVVEKMKGGHDRADRYARRVEGI